MNAATDGIIDSIIIPTPIRRRQVRMAGTDSKGAGDGEGTDGSQGTVRGPRDGRGPVHAHVRIVLSRVCSLRFEHGCVSVWDGGTKGTSTQADTGKGTRRPPLATSGNGDKTRREQTQDNTQGVKHSG
jgi:hypothetical protein